MRKLILSPCGTSLLTNGSNEIERKLVNKHANANEIHDANDKKLLEERIRTVREKLLSCSFEEAKKLSAELNGIISLYNGLIPKEASQDYYILLCTDTWLGEQTALLVESWLKKQNLTTEVRRQKDLQTNNLESFQVALSDLVKWCEEVIKGYKDSQYYVIFNLTGGFKSVQGFLQTLALFYADESVYIFETGNELLRIPRLPVKMAEVDYIRQNLAAFRRLSLELSDKSDSTEKIPETFLLEIDGEKTLSAWGEIVWHSAKKEIYKDCVYESPINKVRFSQKFLKSVENLETDRCVLVNQKVDQLCKYLQTKQNVSSLDFKELKGNPKPPSTHEIDAWSDKDAKRIFCHYENGILVLDELGKGFH
ncbi:MAG: putative CRISPR-associated protein [Leptospiraceae bacterium]|nr:putative CRISPR-associated protein [Leptospiraceae bacterium]